MTPPRQRRGSAPAKAPLIQDRPAERAQRRVLDPDNRDGEFPPNPVAAPREGRPRPSERRLRVVGPKEVGGVRAPGWLVMSLTGPQLDALLAGGHVEDWTGVDGWGSDDTSEPETDAGPADKPMTGTDKEGS